MPEKIHLDVTLNSAHRGRRLDQVLAELFPDYSRSRLQSWVKSAQIQVNGQPSRNRELVNGDEVITVRASVESQRDDTPQAIPLNIVFEDSELLVIDKPAGLVVHPGAGNPDKTLVNALHFHDQDAMLVPRAGIVHRLDKNTSGLMVIAKNIRAQHLLVQAIQARTVKRHYIAAVNGHLLAGGTINAPIGRQPKQRIKMAVVANGKPAITHYRIREKFLKHTLLNIELETGRTHQIRVHFAAQRHSLIGDTLYGYRPCLPKQASDELRQCLQHFPRQALHAAKLAFNHPITQQPLQFEAPLPADLSNLIIHLQNG
jgi:23S rRNA pseudouridine1911/1915/1917 synthase